jgi:hypothetical protein
LLKTITDKLHSAKIPSIVPDFKGSSSAGRPGLRHKPLSQVSHCRVDAHGINTLAMVKIFQGRTEAAPDIHHPIACFECAEPKHPVRQGKSTDPHNAATPVSAVAKLTEPLL